MSRRAIDFTPAPTCGIEARTTLTGDILAVHGDNFRWLPDGTVDLLLTDPPYAIAQETLWVVVRSHQEGHRPAAVPYPL